MIEIDKLVSKRVLELDSYKVEPHVQGIALDKNEIPWSLDGKVEEVLVRKLRTMEFNRYPDSGCTALKKALSKYTGIDAASIGVGNGSDELISVLLQTFIEPGDTIAVCNPSFSMYKIYGSICGARIWEYDLDSCFRIKLEEFITGIQTEKPKVVFLCNPNNPTGGRLELEEIKRILEEAGGIVVVDEAYFEFSGLTAAELLAEYEKLVILRTFSKALGLAALRIGYMLANPAVINYINRVRSPFNVNAFAQAAALEVLENLDLTAERIEMIKSERGRLIEGLTALKVLECFESWSNFILVRSNNAGGIYRRLRETGIHIKYFASPALKDCLRITIGSREENDKFYEAVKEAVYEGTK